MRQLGGYFVFDSPDAGLLASLLPAIVHMRDAERLATLVQLVGDEAIGAAAGPRARAHAPRRGAAGGGAAGAPREDAPPGLLRGLADARLAPALRELHGHVARSWTVTQLARAAALSRSAFFERFTRTVGVPPMEYLLAWRMALAKDLLVRSGSRSPRSPSASVTARRAASARRSAATSASAEPLREEAGRRPDAGAPGTPLYGFVVESVNVSVLLYVPVRSPSLAPIDCLKPIVTASLEVGPFHVLTVCRGIGA